MNIRTACSPFPVPPAFKWEATDDDTGTVGHGPTREAAIEDLLEQLGVES